MYLRSNETLKGLSRGGSGECDWEKCSGSRESHMQRCGDIKSVVRLLKFRKEPHIENLVGK